MSKKSRFHLDSRLASLLSQEYTLTERALKELIDNGWWRVSMVSVSQLLNWPKLERKDTLRCVPHVAGV